MKIIKKDIKQKEISDNHGNSMPVINCTKLEQPLEDNEPKVLMRNVKKDHYCKIIVKALFSIAIFITCISIMFYLDNYFEQNCQMNNFLTNSSGIDNNLTNLTNITDNETNLNTNANILNMNINII